MHARQLIGRRACSGRRPAVLQRCVEPGRAGRRFEQARRPRVRIGAAANGLVPRFPPPTGNEYANRRRTMSLGTRLGPGGKCQSYDIHHRDPLRLAPVNTVLLLPIDDSHVGPRHHISAHQMNGVRSGRTCTTISAYGVYDASVLSYASIRLRKQRLRPQKTLAFICPRIWLLCS